MSIELKKYDGLSLAKLIRDKAISPQELLEATITQAEALNPQLNFITQKHYDLAKQQLATVDFSKPFAGVPLLLKDLGVMLKGTVTSHGSKLFAKARDELTSEVVNRFINRAGVVIFGKTTSPEFGLSFTTEPHAFAPCRNPWNPKLIAGGSSGGAAVAVASRVTPVAHASDGGGSIRVPASCCGIFGLKPSRARVPMGPLVGEGWGGLASHHVLSISVRDSAAMLDCLSGYELGDPYFAPPQKQSYLLNLEKSTKPLKIAYDAYLGDAKPHPQVLQAFNTSQKLCQQLGHELIEDSPNFDSHAVGQAFLVIVAANVEQWLQAWEKQHQQPCAEHAIEPITQAFRGFAQQFSASDYAASLETLHRESRKIATFFSQYHMLLTPTQAKLPLPIGKLASPDSQFADMLEWYNAKQLSFGPYTSLANVTGQPAMSVPLYWTEDNLPIGTQFIAGMGQEHLLFQLARQLEQAKPWKDKVPMLSATL